jgi:adenylate cyclase
MTRSDGANTQNTEHTQNIEIERKFLVADDTWRDGNAGTEIRQGYLARSDRGVVRVRVAGEQAFLTIKGAEVGIRRAEFEYEIPRDDAVALLDLCEGHIIEKTRHRVAHVGHTWEVDVFHAANAGLVLAEIELAREDEAFERPPWLGREVSGEDRYRNSSLSLVPHSRQAPSCTPKPEA